MEHYILSIDHACKLVVAQRTPAPFEQPAALEACFRQIEHALQTVDRRAYVLLVDTRSSPARNDEAFETVLAENRARLLGGFRRTAALAATAAGRLQIQRYARDDHREVFATDSASAAFEYLDIPNHPV
jgi:hypothetical protein